MLPENQQEKCQARISGDKTCPRHIHPKSKEFCVGHDPNDAKDRWLFKSALMEEIKDTPSDVIDVRGWRFPSDNGNILLDFRDHKFEKFVDFEGATVCGAAQFERANFTQGANFDNVKFKRYTAFKGSSFGGTASFRRVCFKEDADFDKTTFTEDVSFNQSIFVRKASFAEITVAGSAKFENSRFRTYVNFNGSSFADEASFARAKFRGDCTFESSDFKDIADLSSTHFYLSTSFASATFKKSTNLSGAVFRKWASFATTEFSGAFVCDAAKFLAGGELTFRDAKFIDEAWFKNTLFDRVCNFERTSLKRVNFLGANRFNNDASFANAVFEDCRFEQTRFKRTTGFENVQCNGNTTFLATEFCGEPKFIDMKFGGQLVFDAVKFCGQALFSVRVDNRDQLRFRNTSLSQVHFRNSSIRNIAFEDVIWPQASFRRFKIADEPLVKAFEFNRPSSQKDDLKEARRLFRDLRLNYDSAGDYEVAGKFYVSECQMTYLMQPPIIRWFHPRGLYRWASNYGESMVQATVVLIGVFFLFAALYWSICSVFSQRLAFKDVPKTLKPAPTATPTPSPPPASSPSPAPSTTPTEGQLVYVCLSKSESLWLSLQASKPLADLGLSPTTFTYWLTLMEGFIVPTQLALFLLAIRRRFRRGD
jgi:uncharacterized protein YjbI with pentapeptide repeats